MFGNNRALEEANNNLTRENENLKNEILSLKAEIGQLTEQNAKNQSLLHGNTLFQELNSSMLGG